MENQSTENRQNGYDEKGRLFGEFKEPTYEEWKEAAIALLKGKPFEKSMITKTPEGIALQPIYTREHLDALPHSESLPGYPPYVRGTKVDGNIDNPWLICQEVYAGLPKVFNEKLMNDLFRGQTAVNMALDVPTLTGQDADAQSASKVGYRGVSISTLEDINVAFHDLVLNVLPLHINTGDNPLPITALVGAYLNQNALSIKEIKGIIGYDPLGHLAKMGQLSTTIEGAYDLMASVTKWIASEASEVRTILVEGHPYHDGGADAVQELAYTLATAAEYIRALLDRGLDIESVSKKLAFSFSLGSNFFMELSKVRASRMLYSKLVEAFGGSDEAQKIYTHAKTSSWTKTVYDPYVNMLRNASEAFSGAIAGVDSLSVQPFDEPIREADDFSRRVSRNVQAVLQDECNFIRPIDPAGGSWYIESLTYEIAENAWKLFQDIEASGGMAKMLERGEIQSAVEMKYDEKFKNMAKRKHVWVGVNMYANMTEEKLEMQADAPDEVSKARAQAVQSYRMRSDIFMTSAMLAELGDHYFTTGEISVPKAIAAAENGATLGDIADECRSFKDQVAQGVAVKKQRGASRFESLRDKTNALKKEGKAPKVFLFNMGPIPQHKGRADFTTGFFEVGGFEVLKNDGFNDTELAIEAGLKSGADIGVICSTDATYPELVPQIAQAVKAKNPNMQVIVAGRAPADIEGEYRQAGVDDFIYMGADCYALLSKLQNQAEPNKSLKEGAQDEQVS